MVERRNVRSSATLLLLALSAAGCTEVAPDALDLSTQAERLSAATLPFPGPTTGGTFYVPVYSTIYLGLNQGVNSVDLGVTLSVRNTSPRLPFVLHDVSYYDSLGKRVRQYLGSPAELGPLATVEFIVQRSDVSGGPGANFLVKWEGPESINLPLVEAVMVGQFGNAGISFTTTGRVLGDELNRENSQQ